MAVLCCEENSVRSIRGGVYCAVAGEEEQSDVRVLASGGCTQQRGRDLWVRGDDSHSTWDGGRTADSDEALLRARLSQEGGHWTRLFSPHTPGSMATQRSGRVSRMSLVSSVVPVLLSPMKEEKRVS